VTKIILDEIDPVDLTAEYKRLIASACLVAWLDATGNFESTHTTRRNYHGLMDLAQKWIKGDCPESWDGCDTYRKWMEIVGIDPDIEPEEMIEKHGATVLAWWNE